MKDTDPIPEDRANIYKDQQVGPVKLHQHVWTDDYKEIWYKAMMKEQNPKTDNGSARINWPSHESISKAHGENNPYGKDSAYREKYCEGFIAAIEFLSSRLQPQTDTEPITTGVDWKSAYRKQVDEVTRLKAELEKTKVDAEWKGYNDGVNEMREINERVIAERDALKAENQKLREALENLMNAWEDGGRQWVDDATKEAKEALNPKP
jgi:regulator of replication initiation timing